MEKIINEAKEAVSELVEVSKIKEGELFVVGCSSSEIAGGIIGKNSSGEIGEVVFSAIYEVLKEKNIYLAAQCCEHLNRALIMEKEAADKFNYPYVNVVPQPKAGGSFATAAYKHFKNPVAVEKIYAKAGMDIGETLIGMHIAPVCVPVRISVKKIGEANVICARSRLKFIGGERAVYDLDLM
ncbi:MAG: TIGR01440 family protein [Ruminococcaceae bacterium]|nr:TIGR01440 family protein [Oscillospiraceae bacterium]